MSKSPRNTKIRYETSIVNGKLFFEDVEQCVIGSDEWIEVLEDKHLKSIRLVSLNYTWTEGVWYTNDTRTVEEINVEMTLRKEMRAGTAHWYAYRRVLGTLYKRYVGQSDKLTERRLIDVARAMPST